MIISTLRPPNASARINLSGSHYHYFKLTRKSYFEERKKKQQTVRMDDSNNHKNLK